MVRGVAREHEFAIRAALGAGRAQALVRTAMEAGVLALAATMLGGAIAIVVIASLPAIVPTNFPRLDEVRIDPLVILPLAVSGIGGTLAIWLPAFRSAWRAHAAIVRGAWASTDSSHVARRYRMFAIAQTALAVVLMVAATLLTRSLVTLMRVDAGYSASNATTARITLHGSRDVPNRWRETATTIAARLNGVTGIEHVGASNMAPFGDTNHVIGFRITSQGGEPLIARALGYVVTPGYLEALRVTLREGRLFTPADLDGATQPIVINEAFARQYLQPSPVIGHQYFDTFAIDVTSEVIGVVGNVLKDGVDRPPQPELYVLAGHQGALATGRQINLVIRGTAGARSLAGPLRALTREVDRDAAVHNITSLQAQRSAAFAQPRLSVELSLTLALLALALAAAGLYGVLTYTVSRRRREWAIRAALGANRATLRAQALRHGLGSAGAGLLIGLLAAAAASRTLQSLLFGVPPFDVWSFFAAAVIVAAVAVAACLVPARRAAATDVASALRSE
jgi:predicted permease